VRRYDRRVTTPWTAGSGSTGPLLDLDGTGRELGGRYQLVAPIGVGASARVFLAVDNQLRRRVALKVLHQALADDERFLRHFRAEARAAAGLSHPNIVGVYDWGEDLDADGRVVPYLVTEYLGGGSLRRMLDGGRVLTASQALIVGLDAARALDHAHRRGLVHRDVKPGNLLFDTDGRLRLADFGLARALAEASWTEPAGVALGTARYASPELALGRRLDGRADVYAVALVLAECVSGRVPLTGETTAATLALRTREDLRGGPELGPLRQIVEWAGRREPAERPSAGELAGALLTAAAELPRPAPLPLAATLGDDEVTSELRVVAGLGTVTPLGPTRHAPVEDDRLEFTGPVGIVPPVDEDEDEGGSGSSVGAAVPAFGRDPIVVAEEHHLLLSSRPAMLGPLEPVAAEGSVVPAPLDAMEPAMLVDPAASLPSDRPSMGGRGRRRGRRFLAVLALLALVGGGFAAWWTWVRVPVHAVPELIGGPVADAAAVADRLGWRLAPIEEVRQDGTLPGEVVGQSPTAGESLAEGGTLQLTISLGPTLVAVPDLVGVPEADARSSVDAAGLRIGGVTTANDEEVPAGSVVVAAATAGADTSDPDGRLPKGTPLELTVSTGPAPRAVPDGLAGLPLADARARLSAVGLGVDVEGRYDDDAAAGTVVEVGSSAGTMVPRGTDVRLVVSRGPAPVPVPDVAGRSGTAAAAALEAAGFPVSGIEGPPSGRVLATDPPAGERHQRGTAVRVFTRS
jgi:eukaryotic-like serine/threonine-protein kinase